MTVDSLRGKRADRERHEIARATLVKLLTRDARVMKFLDSVAEETGLTALRNNVFESMDEIAQVLGITRCELFDPTNRPKLPKRSKKRDAQLSSAAERFTENVKRLLQAYSSGAATKDVIGFMVAELRLQWHWLVGDLVVMLFSRLMGGIGGSGEMEVPVRTQEHIQLTVKDGSYEEAVDDARAQLAKLFNRNQDVGEIRYRRPAADKIRRNTEWFYLVKIKRPPESIRSIAAKYHQSQHPNCKKCDYRSIVQTGLKEIDRILGSQRPPAKIN